MHSGPALHLKVARTRARFGMHVDCIDPILICETNFNLITTRELLILFSTVYPSSVYQATRSRCTRTYVQKCIATSGKCTMAMAERSTLRTNKAHAFKNCNWSALKLYGQHLFRFSEHLAVLLVRSKIHAVPTLKFQKYHSTVASLKIYDADKIHVWGMISF